MGNKAILVSYEHIRARVTNTHMMIKTIIHHFLSDGRSKVDDIDAVFKKYGIDNLVINPEHPLTIVEYAKLVQGLYTLLVDIAAAKEIVSKGSLYLPHKKITYMNEFHKRRLSIVLRYNFNWVKEVRITGSHYNFLNYTRMEQLDESTIKRGNTNTAKKVYDFPKFIDSQFWMFHCMEFAENNGFHLIIDKTRRGGFSYMMAADSANRVNAQSRKVAIHVAIDNKYLIQTGGLTDFSVNDLKFYEEKTPFVRGIYSPVKQDFRLGYKLPSGIEADDSWKSS